MLKLHTEIILRNSMVYYLKQCITAEINLLFPLYRKSMCVYEIVFILFLWKKGLVKSVFAGCSSFTVSKEASRQSSVWGPK